MRRPYRPFPAVAVALLLLAGCGGSGDDKDADAEPSVSSTPNTVAGCEAAAVKAIKAGDLSAPDDSGDYPECVGLSEAEQKKAFEGALADPAVEQAMIDIVEKGIGAVRATPDPDPTLPPDPDESPSPVSSP